ncbi:zinc finger protein [Rutstroemia sp. NJR-2017a BBW]|nr:zinc finger protein [Rutstroemia sp. NJR-2017a BBW]
MDVMELVENEQNARPFQCDWKTCSKSSSLARHRRIHTGKRPYKCAHEGCLKRKTTMVKHQRRSHQRGIHSSELDDGETSDSDMGESPTTPQHSGQMQWPQNLTVPGGVVPQGHHMHRAHSFADFGQQQITEGFPMQHGYNHRHSLSGGAQNYGPIPEQHHPHHPMMQRAPSLQHASYYIPEQNNPGVATLNTNPAPIQTYHIPRQQMERHSQEILQSSPSSYSSQSRASPVSQEPYYTHNPHPTQAATYALHGQSPIDQPPMIQYQPHMPHQNPHSMPGQVPQVSHIQEYAPPAEQHGHWYDNAPYQAPEVIGHVSAYPQVTVFSDPWPKLETYDDPSLQMPSDRIASL